MAGLPSLVSSTLAPFKKSIPLITTDTKPMFPPADGNISNGMSYAPPVFRMSRWNIGQGDLAGPEESVFSAYKTPLSQDPT